MLFWKPTSMDHCTCWLFWIANFRWLTTMCFCWFESSRLNGLNPLLPVQIGCCYSNVATRNQLLLVLINCWSFESTVAHLSQLLLVRINCCSFESNVGFCCSFDSILAAHLNRFLHGYSIDIVFIFGHLRRFNSDRIKMHTSSSLEDFARVRETSGKHCEKQQFTGNGQFIKCRWEIGGQDSDLEGVGKRTGWSRRGKLF